MLEKACQAGYAHGCGEVAHALHWGRCSDGDIASCRMVAENPMPGHNGFAKDNEKGLELYRKACELGSARSCVDAANALEGGTYGVAENPGVAAELLERACGLGDSAACGRAERVQKGQN